jgi:hypothetical protein
MLPLPESLDVAASLLTWMATGAVLFALPFAPGCR